MNALADIDKKLYIEWTGKEWDCYYDDNKCSAFMCKLAEVWGTE